MMRTRDEVANDAAGLAAELTEGTGIEWVGWPSPLAGDIYIPCATDGNLEITMYPKWIWADGDTSFSVRFSDYTLKDEYIGWSGDTPLDAIRDLECEIAKKIQGIQNIKRMLDRYSTEEK